MASTTRRSDGKPCRPRSSYNFFFQEQVPKISALMLRGNGKKGTYTQLSAAVSKLWKEADHQTRAHYQTQAVKDKRRYGLELVRWRIQQEEKAKQEGACETNKKNKRKAKRTDKGRVLPTTLSHQTQDKHTPLPLPDTLSAPKLLPDMQPYALNQDALDDSSLEPSSVFPTLSFHARPFSAPPGNVASTGDAAGAFDGDDAMFLYELFGYETD